MQSYLFEYTGSNDTWSMSGSTPSVTGTLTVNSNGFFVTINNNGNISNYTLDPYLRYRQLYNDYTFSQAAGICTLITPLNTCRVPDPGKCPPGPCPAIPLNVPTYQLTNCDKCSCTGGGRPIDIDVGCKNGGGFIIKPSSSDLNSSSMSLIWSGGSNIVPVINNVLYDTSINSDTYLLYTAGSIEELRVWVCHNMRFVTIIDSTLLATQPCLAVLSNWPYVDLYSNSNGCVSPVPC